MWLFIEPLLIRDKNYIECAIEFKIKGDKFVNDAKVQLDFQCE